MAHLPGSVPETILLIIKVGILTPKTIILKSIAVVIIDILILLIEKLRFPFGFVLLIIDDLPHFIFPDFFVFLFVDPRSLRKLLL